MADRQHTRLAGSATPVVIMTNKTRSGRAAAVIPLDDNFEGRVQAARRLSRLLNGQRGVPPPGGLTKQQRDKHRLMLRALDANPPSETYGPLRKDRLVESAFRQGKPGKPMPYG